MPLLLWLAVALLTVAIVRLVRRERELVGEMAALDERAKDLGLRLEAAEGEVAQAVTQAEIAENVLLEKGVADEDDIEAVRRRFVADATSGYDRARDGELN
jgi:hypothetical protein